MKNVRYDSIDCILIPAKDEKTKLQILDYLIKNYKVYCEWNTRNYPNLNIVVVCGPTCGYSNGKNLPSLDLINDLKISSYQHANCYELNIFKEGSYREFVNIFNSWQTKNLTVEC